MKAAIVEEAHNHVVWEIETSLLGVELGLLIGGTCAALVLVATPSPLRWTVAGLVLMLTVLSGGFLALTTPLGERGELVRTLDGGNVTRLRRWLFFGRRLAWEAPLAVITAFRPELCTFEDNAAQTYTLSRLVAVLTDAEPVPLTDWLDPSFVLDLVKSLTKAARLASEAEWSPVEEGSIA